MAAATLTAKDILAEVDRRKDELGMRQRAYRKAQDAYDGKAPGAGEGMGTDAAGRNIQADRIDEKRSELAQRPGTPNMIEPIVDDQVALIGRMPQMRVLPWGDDPDDVATMQRLSRVLRAQWLHSNMPVQLVEAARWMLLKREVLYHLTAIPPDQARDMGIEPGIYITAVDPELCMPSFGGGWDRFMLRDVIIRERMSGLVARRNWPDARIDAEQDDIDVFHYIGPAENCIVIGEDKVQSVQHDLGFCPAVWMQASPGKKGSSVSSIVDLAAELRVIFAVMEDSLVDAVFAPLVVENPESFDEKFEVGPGAPPIVTKSGGKAYRVQPGAVPNAAQGLLSMTRDYLLTTSGEAPVRVDQSLDGSNISGRAVAGVQAPGEQRLQINQQVMCHFFQALNSMVMLAFHRLPALRDAEMVVSGVEVVAEGTLFEKTIPYVETFSGGEFKGWARNEVRFGSSVGTSTHERYLILANLHKEGAVGGPFVLEQLGVPDAERVFADGQREFLQRAQGMAAGQPKGHHPGAPPGAPPGGPPPGMGGGPDAGAAPPPGAPPPEAAGASPGGPAQPPPPPPGMPPVDTAPTEPAQAFPGPLPGGDMQKRIKAAMVVAQASYHGLIVDAQPFPGGVRVIVQPAAKGGSSKAPVRAAFHAQGFDEVQIVDERKATAGTNGSAPGA